VRTSGEYAAWQQLNLHSMTAAEKGGTVHVQVGGVGHSLLVKLVGPCWTDSKQQACRCG
jgi:cytochrome c551/c552